MFVRPAPARPDSMGQAGPRFAFSASSISAPLSPPSPILPLPISAPNDPRSTSPNKQEMVEIPRFKKRELHLGIIRKRSYRAAWIALWVTWVSNGLLGLVCEESRIELKRTVFRHQRHLHRDPVSFDHRGLNEWCYRCAICPTSGTHLDRSWVFATVAYAICWSISIFGVWIGWEVWYCFWRRWRPR